MLIWTRRSVILCLLFLLVPLSASTPAVIRGAIPPTVYLIACRPGTLSPMMTGTGVLIHRQGYLLTSFHNAGDPRTGRLRYDLYAYLVPADDPYAAPEQVAYRVRILRTNRALDLLLGKIDARVQGNRLQVLDGDVQFPALRIGNSDRLEPPEAITALGFPAVARTSRQRHFSGITVVQGRVSGLDRSGYWIKADANVSPGNSGGPSINARGELIGINTAVNSEPRTQGRIALIRPINTARHLTADFPELYRLFSGDDLLRPDGWRPVEERVEESPDGPPDASFRGAGIVHRVDTQAPLSGVDVFLYRDGSTAPLGRDMPLAIGRSDQNGEFVFNRRLPAGRYLFRAVAPGYRVVQSSVTLGPSSDYFRVSLKKE